MNALVSTPVKPCHKCGTCDRSPRGACKACSRVRNAAWYAANPDYNSTYYAANSERIKATSAVWAAANPDKARAASDKWAAANAARVKVKAAAWRAANRARRKATNAAWQAANTDRIKAQTAAWAKSNPEARRVNKHNRRARKLAVGGSLSKGLSAKLFILQMGKCPCCKLPLGNDYHMDHITPIARGGSNTDDNIQLLRSICNLQKSAKHPIDFMQERGKLL